MTAEPAPDLELNPAARLLWRGPDAVQLELAGQAVVVSGSGAASLARHVAGSAPAGTPAPPPPGAGLRELHDNGWVWPRAADPDDPRRAPPRARLAGELAALTAVHGERAAELLAARRHYAVEVLGRSSTAVQCAAALAAAGIGRVRCVTAGSARIGHAAPGGVLVEDEGLELATAAAEAVCRAAPDVDLTPLPPDDVPNLVVLAEDLPVSDERRAALHATGVPHLRLAVGAEHGVVGPLVLPGLTSCLRCADLHRTDRDPAWPVLAVQLLVPPRQVISPSVAVAMTTVGVAVGEALIFLDGGEPATLGGTLETRAPDWRVRRRSWPPHPRCDCGLAPTPAPSPTPAPAATGPAPTAAGTAPRAGPGRTARRAQ